MKKDDKVMVNWPTGKGGPYKYHTSDITRDNVSVVLIDHRYVLVEDSWIEPVPSTPNSNRLYYYWNDYEPEAIRYTRAAKNPSDVIDWDHYEPVFKTWEELERKTQLKFLDWLFFLTDIYHTTTQTEAIYKKVYHLVTGEEHP